MTTHKQSIDNHEVDSIIQGLWIGRSLPLLQQLSIKSFLDHGHEYHLYVYDEVPDVPIGTTICDGNKILTQDNIFYYQSGFGKGSVSAFSNLFRYELIFRKGGWWVDTDVVCLSKFDFVQPIVIATEREENGSLLTATSAFKSPPDASFLKYCLDICATKDYSKIKWSEIGPFLLDQAVRRHNLEEYRVDPQVFSPVDYFKFEEIIKPDFDLSLLRNAKAIHLWNQMWKSNQIDINNPPPGSLYWHLIEKHL